jgi:hypothetical protein
MVGGARHLLQLHKLDLEQLVQQLPRVLHGKHRLVRNLLLFELPLQQHKAEDAARRLPEALPHNRVNLPRLWCEQQQGTTARRAAPPSSG